MPRVGICCNQGGEAAAQQLSQQLGLPQVENHPGQLAFDYLLEVDEHDLSMRSVLDSSRSRGPIRAVLSGDDIKRRIRAGRRSNLARAVGLKANQPSCSVLDTTAGLGCDAAVLAGLGMQVSLLERNRIIHALLASGISHWRCPHPGGQLELLPCQDAVGFLTETRLQFDVVFIDPMFPKRKKQALAHKEMQTLRQLLQDEPQMSRGEETRWLQLACERATMRVVVKRHARSRPFACQAPNHSIAGNRVRYDVYLSTHQLRA